jgi:RNA polymerase sigma factor (sigma-70 family)
VAVQAGLSDAEAQEVVQETIIGVARKIGEFKADPAHGSFGAWLMQLTRWRIADQWRKRGNAAQATYPSRSGAVTGQNPAETGSTGPIERIPDPAGAALDATWETEWKRHLMTEALERVKRRVSPRQFQMFELHVFQELTVREVARTLKTSPAAVYMAKQRVGRLLKKQIRVLRGKDEDTTARSPGRQATPSDP